MMLRLISHWMGHLKQGGISRTKCEMRKVETKTGKTSKHRDSCCYRRRSKIKFVTYVEENIQTAEAVITRMDENVCENECHHFVLLKGSARISAQSPKTELASEITTQWGKWFCYRLCPRLLMAIRRSHLTNMTRATNSAREKRSSFLSQFSWWSPL